MCYKTIPASPLRKSACSWDSEVERAAAFAHWARMPGSNFPNHESCEPYIGNVIT
jgi:hypothetical protein